MIFFFYMKLFCLWWKIKSIVRNYIYQNSIYTQNTYVFFSFKKKIYDLQLLWEDKLMVWKCGLTIAHLMDFLMSKERLEMEITVFSKHCIIWTESRKIVFSISFRTVWCVFNRIGKLMWNSKYIWKKTWGRLKV